MKKRILGIIALMLVTVIALTGCSIINSVVDFVSGIINPAVELTDAALDAEKIINFADGANPDVLFESDGWSNGDVFNVVWKKNNVVYENGIMRLGITEEKATAWLDEVEVEFNYTAGEARTQNYYHYGDFEVCMKPSANPGTASTFFTCTGPYDAKFVLDENGDYVLDENGQRTTVANPHDEIDIEFLGNDTTHVQFNFFVDGVGGNEYMYNLGFDASEDFHTYGYRWESDSITWFVDGEPVYKVTTDTSVEAAGNIRIVEKLPSTPGRILTNYWCGTERAAGWMGVYEGAKNDNGTEYKWIATSAEGAPLNPEEKPDEEIVGIDWSKIEAIAPTFASTDIYTVVNDGTQSNVTYSEVGGSSYINVEMDISEASADKNYLHLVVTNNAEVSNRFRVNVVDSELVAAGAQNMSTNLSATVNGETAYTDLVWGGSFFDLAPGETYEIVIEFNGVVEKLQLMPDSSKNDTSVNAGDITVSEIKFAKIGEIDIPDDPKPDPTPDPDPTPNPDTGYQFNFWVSSNAYVTSGNNIKYNGAGNTYACVGTDVAALAAGKNTFTVTITNNGAADSRVRVDVQGTTQVGNHTVLNTAATGGDVWTDMDWGGSTVTVPAGQSVTLVITYDEATDRGAVTNLVVFVDSGRGDGATYSSDITLSGMAFSKVGGEETDDPSPDPSDLTASGEYVKFAGNDCYTITCEAEYSNIFNVTYSNVSDNTYQNINAYIADKAAGKTKLGLIIGNNGSETVNITVKLEATGAVALGEYKVTVAPGEAYTLYGEFTGDAEMLYLFIDSGWATETNTHSGNITLTGIAFN